VNGILTASSSVNTIVGKSTATNGAAMLADGAYNGVLGFASTTSGTTYGVAGEAQSTSGIGVGGFSFATTGTTYGVYGSNASPGRRSLPAGSP